jgi:hypothetical protein
MRGQNCNGGATGGKTYKRARHWSSQKSVKAEGFRRKAQLSPRLRRKSVPGLDRAVMPITMKRFQTEVVEPLLRESCLCSRSVAVAASHLNYWTDFGRLTTTLP